MKRVISEQSDDIEKNGRIFVDQAWMEKRENLYLLHLKGSQYDIGYQQGVLLSKEIKKGAVNLYADTLRGEKMSPLKKIIARQVLKKKIYKPVERSQPKEILEQFHGIADGSGVSYKTIFRSNHRPNVSMILTPVIFKNYLKKFNNMGIDLRDACSIFVATKEATSNGLTIIGRNTDYSGIEAWPKYQTISFVEPENGFKYMQTGTAGILIWAPGMNENGIVVCAHSMKYDDVDSNGWSIAAFTDAILRTAENLEDAIKILHKNPRSVSCGFVITDGKSKEAFAAEVSTSKATIRWMENNRLVMTNMAISEEMRKIDLVAKYNLNEGCPGRYWRLMQLIEENYGKIDPLLAATFMGDHIRYTTGTERNAYGIVAVDDNVNSIIFSPEELRFWIAIGPAPVCNNFFIGFDFKGEIKGKSSTITPEILEGYKFKDSNKRKAMEKFNQAYILYENNSKKIKKILNLIQEALKFDPEEIIYYQMIAKFLIHQGQYDEAIKNISKALDFKQSLNERAHNYLLLGILHDLKGDRANAARFYDEIKNLVKNELKDSWFKVNRVISAFAEKYRKAGFNKKNLNERPVIINFSQGSGIE